MEKSLVIATVCRRTKIRIMERTSIRRARDRIMDLIGSQASTKNPAVAAQEAKEMNKNTNPSSRSNPNTQVQEALMRRDLPSAHDQRGIHKLSLPI